MFRKEKWEIKRLGEITTLRYGKNLTDKMRNLGDVPVYGSAGIVGWHNKSITNSLTLIIARKGSVGNIFISENSCFPIDTTFYIDQSSCELNLRWLYIFLLGSDLKRLNMATAVPGINRGILHNIQIPIPPLEEQKQIVELFQTIDQTIDQVENQQSQLLQLRRVLCDGLIFRQPYFGNLLTSESCLPLLLEAIADSIEEHDKTKTDITRFVGLENIEPGVFQIKSWGNIKDGTTFTKRFRVGDVLFGKRRAYLKKVAIATFDGICSSDILVMRAKPEKILPGLLPFYVASEPFIEYAVTTSAGSLSPRTKWKDLAKFEISLPDLKTQEKILSVLQGIETIRLQLANQKSNLKKLKQQLLNEILG